MKAIAKITEREKGGKVEIILPNRLTYRITWWDDKPELIIQSVDGSMNICPSVSNEIKITTNE